MTDNKMVKPSDHSSGNENAYGQIVPAHTRNQSHDSTNSRLGSQESVPESSNKILSDRPSRRRTKSTTNSKTKSRPTYSRKYSTPPSRPLSPAGFPKHLELDAAIPELHLSEARFTPVVNHHLCVDTAPQNPDIWSDPETDYFSTIEGSNSKHARAKSKRFASQNINNLGSLNAFMTNPPGSGLQQVKEAHEIDFFLPPTPGGFAG